VICLRDEFLSEEDLDLRNLTQEELFAYWDAWLRQAQSTNSADQHTYSHGVFATEPAVAAASKEETGCPDSRRRVGGETPCAVSEVS
jgi:hypothetical protein